MGKISIGNIGFARPVTQQDRDAYRKRFNWDMPDHTTLIGVSIMGEDRCMLLRAAFRGETLPEGLVLVVNYPSGPFNVPVTRDEVRWNVEGEGSANGRVVDGIWEVKRG